MKSLGDEVRNLAHVADSIHRSWTRNPRVSELCAKDDTELWSNVKVSLDDCQTVISRLSEGIESEHEGAARESSAQDSARSIAFELESEDVEQFHEQIHSHCNAMQCALLTIEM